MSRGFMNGLAVWRPLLAPVAIGLIAAAPLWAQPPVNPIRIFFPPTPPVLGEPLTRSAPATVSPANAAPAGLASYLNAPFYAPLSTRLAKNDLDDSLSFRIESYRSSRAALLAELRAELDSLKEASPASRAAALTIFAQDQTPRIAGLEQTAERLRQDLAATGSGWNEYVRWRVGIFTLPPMTAATRSLFRRQFLEAAVYYQRGLSPDQRRLISAETRDLSLSPAGPGTADSPEVLDFSPASARIVIPPDLPPDLSRQIAAYRTDKAALEAEIISALFGPEKDAESRDQIVAMATLAHAEAPRFAALEAQAEAIRRGLAVLNDPFQPPALPAIPPALAARITAHRAEQISLQKALLARVEAAKRPLSSSGGAPADAIQRAITEFTQENAARYDALNQDRDAIRTELAKLPGIPATGGGSSPDALLTKFSQSLRDLERAWDYRDYQTATLQPGLSPEQRRLLFGGALEKLALPLPGASLWFGAL